MGEVVSLSNWKRSRPYRRPRFRGCTERQFRFMCDWYGNRCLACKEKKPLTADHVYPLRKGGDHGVANLQPLCRSCNSKKGANYSDYRPLVGHIRMMDEMQRLGILVRL